MLSPSTLLALRHNGFPHWFHAAARRFFALALSLVLICSIQLTPAGAQDTWLDEAFGRREPDRSAPRSPKNPQPGPASTGNWQSPPRTNASGNDNYLPPMRGMPSSTPSDRNDQNRYSDRPTPGRQAAPYGNSRALPESARTVERSELEPVTAGDGSGLPYELWRGLDIGVVESLLAKLSIPPRSAALHELWVRLLTSNVSPPGGSGETETARFAAMRIEALYRSGLLAEIPRIIDNNTQIASDPVVMVLTARAKIALDRDDEGCALASRIASSIPTLPEQLKGQAILLTGHCATRSDNTAAAELIASLGRENGLDAASFPGLAALEAIAFESKPQISTSSSLSVIDYKLLQRAGTPADASLLANATPALLVALSRSPQVGAEQKIAAAEGAAAVNAIEARELAAVYRSAAGEAGQSADPVSQPEGPLRRAALFSAAEQERTPFRKVRLIRTYLDSAHRVGLGTPALLIMADTAAGLFPVPEIGWFAETAIEIALAANQPGRLREWIDVAGQTGTSAGSDLEHWMALADIAFGQGSSQHGEVLQSVERMALTGRFGSDQLHRLATVLDALEYSVPIPLWEAASRTPQPNTGHLPATGVLTDLQAASRSKEFGRTVLLAMQALGSGGPEGAHMIALGDTIRALRRAGLTEEARRIGFEALFAAWPRRANG